jgi:hypothetical protein
LELLQVAANGRLGELAPAPVSRHSLKPEILNGCNAALTSLSTTGHNRPVEVTFQFLLVLRPVIELNGRYSATKLTSLLPRPGHEEAIIPPKHLRRQWQLTDLEAAHHYKDQVDQQSTAFALAAISGGRNQDPQQLRKVSHFSRMA